MSGDDLAELLRASVEQQRAEAASARAAHTLAEAEGRAEDDQEAAAEVVQARERYEAAVAAAEAARSRRREIEARFAPRDVDRAHVTLAGGGRG